MTDESHSNARSRLRQCLNFTVPVAGFVACICGVLLVLGVLTAGALSLVYVFIPCAVIGGISTLWVILGALIGSCSTAGSEDDGTGRPVSRTRNRPSAVAMRRRADILERMNHLDAVPEGTDTRTCSICLSDTPPQRVLLFCGHMFHENCIKEWMTRARLARCPLCRSGLNTPGLPQPAGDESSPNHADADDVPPV